VETPWGRFGAAVSPAGLGRLTFPEESLEACDQWAQRWWPGVPVRHDQRALAPLAEQLNAYLSGAVRTFTLPVDLRGTPFQLQVWQALRAIPYGSVRSYTELANAIARPRAVRAVALANGANPVPIVVPCHRVIGHDGSLTGYGGGLELKARLLRLEGAPFRAPAAPAARQAALML
jgi:methylated-DNA-[protein]-cysteine S-methyltransferase